VARHENRRATIAYHNDGNGGRAISVNLSLVQFAAGMVLQLAAVCSLGWAVATFVGKAQVREWWRSEGAPAMARYVGDEIMHHNDYVNGRVNQVVDTKLDGLRDDVQSANTLAATNRSILQRIEEDVRELRKLQASRTP